MNIPNEVQDMMDQYINLFNEYFKGELEGVYLHGSLALNVYTPGLSDIDFITVTKSRFTEENLEKISEMHMQFEDLFNNASLDGVYITEEDIGRQKVNRDKKYIYYYEGSTGYGSYFNFNPVTWWLF